MTSRQMRPCRTAEHTHVVRMALGGVSLSPLRVTREPSHVSRQALSGTDTVGQVLNRC